MHTLFLIILAFIIPPLAVFMKLGSSYAFFLNITVYLVGMYLAVFFDFPYGAFITALHALWIILMSD